MDIKELVTGKLKNDLLELYELSRSPNAQDKEIADQIKSKANKYYLLVTAGLAFRGETKIKKLATDAHAKIAHLDDGDVEEAAARIRAIDRATIEKLIGHAFGKVDFDKAAQELKDKKEGLSGAQNADIQSATKAARAMLPPVAAGFVDKAEQLARANPDIISNAEDAKTFLTGQVTDVVLEIAHKTTPDKLKSMAAQFTQAVSADEFSQTAVDAARMVQEALKSTKSTGSPMNIEDMARADRLAAEIHHMLTVAEEAVQAAGLMPDVSRLLPPAGKPKSGPAPAP